MSDKAVFNRAFDTSMKFEVGPFWDSSNPAVINGLIDTPSNRKLVGYVNHPSDTGGETKFGIAQNSNPDLDITTLTLDQAKRVYYKKYWLAIDGDKLYQHKNLCAVLFDTAINHGVSRASKILQEVLGVPVDGDIGPITIINTHKYIISKSEIMLCDAIFDKRLEHYNRIVANNPTQKVFLNGWLNRLHNLRLAITK